VANYQANELAQMIQSMSRVLGTRRLLPEDVYHPAHVTRSLIRRYMDAADGEHFDLKSKWSDPEKDRFDRRRTETLRGKFATPPLPHSGRLDTSMV
jgi:hypothetical protein